LKRGNGGFCIEYLAIGAYTCKIEFRQNRRREIKYLMITIGYYKEYNKKVQY
jgi:hypothetical protein